ncbi:MAG: TonB family protein [Pseudomonadota bacterium]
MRILALAAAAALAVQLGAVQPGAAQKAGPADPAPLKHSFAWGIDYGTDACTLSMSFGTGADMVSLGFIPLTGGGSVKIAIIGNAQARLRGSGSAMLVSGAEARGKRAYYSLTDPKTSKPVALIKATRGDLPAIAASKALTLRTDRDVVAFALPGMPAALKALEACETDLARTWGYDPALVATPAKPIEPWKWLTGDDYPRSAMEDKNGGETDLRVTVGLDGAPTGCLVTLKSESEMLDRRACTAVMSRARFEPAMGTDGKPAPGLYATAVLWMVPRMGTY